MSWWKAQSNRGSSALLVAALLGGAAPLAAQAPHPTRLVLGTYGDAAVSEVGAAILREAYRRLGITIEIQRFAGDVGIDRSETGAVDGEVVRVDGIEDRYPTLVQVRTPVTFTDIWVFSRDTSLHARDWRDLGSLRVATVRGVFALERSIGELHVRYVDTYSELYPLLLSGQVDAIVAPELQTRLALGSDWRGVVHSGMLASYVQYHYLNRKHVDLVPEVTTVLRNMLLDGTTARIRDARIAEMASGRTARAR